MKSIFKYALGKKEKNFTKEEIAYIKRVKKELKDE